VPATPRRLVDNNGASGRKRSAEEMISVTSKKSRRSSKEVHCLQANTIMQTKKKKKKAMKLATTRITAKNLLPKGHAEKKSINCIVKEVNMSCDSNISPKTAGTYALKGRINTSPLKRGPVDDFPKPVLESLKWAYVSGPVVQPTDKTHTRCITNGYLRMKHDRG